MADSGIHKTGWTNWSGNQIAPDAQFLQPRSEEDLRETLTQGEGPVRLVGAGHSFTPIVATSGTVINLDHMGGVVCADPQTNTATIRAGTRLKDLSPELEQHGLAFKNLGDINVQSFAGATATATHGTGETFGCLSSEITGVRIMKADGSILEGTLDTNPDLIHAAQVSLGALGVLLEATIRLCPSYNLHRRTSVEPIETILQAAPERWSTHRNFEFYYIPFSGLGLNISHDETDTPETERPPSDDEAAMAAIKSMRDKFKWSSFLRRRLLSAGFKNTRPESTIGPSWQLLATTRETLFNEMEYHLPVETGLDAFRDVIKYIERHQRKVYFPIEIRKTAGDDGWLSPFQGAPRISVAVHAPADEDHSWFFEAAEPIFRAAGGRPHWGKLHSLEAEDLSGLYPDFARFTALRRDLDPEGRFMTPALARIWGES